MWQMFNRWVERYDQWCESLGYTPELKRSCVPYRKEEYSPKVSSNQHE
jgi:hypothetical protein